MSVENDFVPFATGAGANVLTQTAYLASPNLSGGQQPGVASSALNNKALRQATYIASCIAQYLANFTGNNVLDDGNQSEVLSTMALVFNNPPTFTILKTGSGTYNPPSGPSPVALKIRAIGGGSGGAGCGPGAGSGGAGGNTTFGSFITAGGASASSLSGNLGGVGGIATLTTGGGVSGIGFNGAAGSGNTGAYADSSTAPSGASSPFGGGGGGGVNGPGSSAYANTGAGGGGSNVGTGTPGGSSGGAGAYIEAIITGAELTTIISSGISYSIGTGGSGGTAGSSGDLGGSGGSGLLFIEEIYS
jgi:hypothetical protein